tara:strand:+ start:3680 stop:4750 length:1071 start_codon:yes stop_codon:yes gene_type:complete
MQTIDDDWESFLNGYDYDCTSNNKINTDTEKNDSLHDVDNMPKCSDIYISTKTKISYLNKSNIDIKDIFWKIPVINYNLPSDGVIKKQIKCSSTSKDEVNEIENKLKEIDYYDEQIIEHIDNPDGRIKFKDQRKISIGLSSKDILTYRSKKKRAFFNCFVLIIRILEDDKYKEMHVKVFNTGKLEIPGIQNDNLLIKLLDLLVNILRPYIGEDLNYLFEKNETVLINSNFNCGYFIDRDKLFDLLKFKYRINSNYDACSYPGIQCKFYFDNTLSEQTGKQPTHKDYQEVSFMIFRTGSVLIVGKCNENILLNIYNFLRNILETEYNSIVSSNKDSTNLQVNKNRKKKIRKKMIYFN